jgi:hypothetical protein
MDSQVGSNGPGAIGKSSFTSGNASGSPIGTEPSGTAGGTGGGGVNGGSAGDCAKPYRLHKQHAVTHTHSLKRVFKVFILIFIFQLVI